MNAGISEVVGGIRYFGCSFTDFAPALRPSYPRAAIDPYLLSYSDVDYWIGTGSDTALLVVDFNDGGNPESFVWGYLYDDSQNITAGDMMNAIARDDVLLSVNTGSFCNDITYDNHSGLAGNPYYWSTWSATNTGNWRMNAGIGEVLHDGDWFGCSYEAWPPPMPGVPSAAPSNDAAVAENEWSFTIYPNPFQSALTIKTDVAKQQTVQLVNSVGQQVVQEKLSGSLQLNTADIASGVYLLIVREEGRIVYTQKLVK